MLTELLERIRSSDPQTQPQLLSELIALAHSIQLEINILEPIVRANSRGARLATICLGNVCIGSKLHNLQRVLQILSPVLISTSDQSIISSTLKSISIITNENTKLAADTITTLLPVIERLIFISSTSSNVAILESDSEVSDSSDSRSTIKMKPEWKVQYQALLCLESLSKMRAQWTKFMPPTSDAKNSLMYILLRHPSEKVKGAVCKVLVSFFTESKQYVSIAAHEYYYSNISNRTKSFTSLSQLLANQLFVTIDLLTAAIVQHSTSPLSSELYIALNVIIRNCNLGVLEGDLNLVLYSLFSSQCISNSDYRHLILDCLASLVDQMEQNTFYTQIWLQALQYSSSRVEVIQTSVLNIFASLAVKVPHLIWSEWGKVHPIVSAGLASLHNAVILSALKILEHFAHASISTPDLDLPLNWWTRTFENTAPFWMSGSTLIRCVSCQLIAHIPLSVSQEMNPRLLTLVVTSSLAYGSDEHQDVRAIACGTIGALITLPIFRTDVKYLSDVSAIIPSLCDDTALKVRIRAFWALGVLADALQELELAPHLEVFQPSQLIPLFRVSIAGCSDQERVKLHAFRAFGRVISMIPTDILQYNIALISVAVDNLILSLKSGAFKTRWNASHCLRLVMGCKGFPLGGTVTYTDMLFSSLIDVASSSQNFKVKTGAIGALAMPDTLSRYETTSQSSISCIKAIILGLVDTAKSIERVLLRATKDDQKYLIAFVDSINKLRDHLQLVSGPLWDNQMSEIDLSIGIILLGIGKEVTSFDPKGI